MKLRNYQGTNRVLRYFFSAKSISTPTLDYAAELPPVMPISKANDSRPHESRIYGEARTPLEISKRAEILSKAPKLKIKAPTKAKAVPRSKITYKTSANSPKLWSLLILAALFAGIFGYYYLVPHKNNQEINLRINKKIDAALIKLNNFYQTEIPKTNFEKDLYHHEYFQDLVAAQNTTKSKEKIAQIITAPEIYQVPAGGRFDFQDAFASSKANSLKCANPKQDAGIKAMGLCLLSLDTNGALQALFSLKTPDARSLHRNLTSIEIALDNVSVNQKLVAVTTRNFAWLERNTTGNLQQNFLLAYKKDPSLNNLQISSVNGRLLMRLPRKLGHVSLYANPLGEVMANNGLRLKIIKINDGSLEAELSGPIASLVQFIPADANNQQLATSNERLEPIDKDGLKWKANFKIYGVPKFLHIVYAAEQDILEYPFKIKVGK